MNPSDAAPIFVTSNPNKLREVSGLLGIELEAATVDVPEIQSLDFAEVATAKVLAARSALGDSTRPVMVDDSGLVVAAWNGFPGPLTKWLLQSVGNAGLLEMLEPEEDLRATAVCVVAVTDSDGTPNVFRGEVAGNISRTPRGEGGFGFDPIFQPGTEAGRTYAEMGPEKERDSHRTRAFLAVGEWLEQQGVNGTTDKT